VDEPHLDFDTLAAQAGIRVRVGDAISTVPPIDPSTTFTYDSIEGVHRALAPEPHGFAYSRNANPTVAALEGVMESLEGADQVVAFGSGMAAVHGALLGAGLEAGDAIVASSDLYGVTRSLFAQLAGFDLETRYVDILDLEAVDRALSDSAVRMLYFESISNPLLRVPDVAELARLARAHRAISVIDNTFATPYLLRPLQLGVDIVVHSATKYIAGHGDVVAGLVATRASYAPRIRAVRTSSGAVLSPFEAWLAMRGLRTLPLRVSRQSASALEIALWLDGEAWVQKVYYPGLPSHPQHDVATRQFGEMSGGMVAFELSATQEEALAFMDGLRLITKGTSLGDVESLVLYPPLSSHRSLTPDELRAAGIEPGLIRLSVGLESPRDLRDDLARAARLAGIAAATSSVTG